MSDPSPDSMVTLSVVTAVPGLWSFLCPPVLDQSPYADQLVRTQQAKACFISLAFGTLAGLMVKKPYPFLVAVGMCVIMLAEYESSRKRQAAFEASEL